MLREPTGNWRGEAVELFLLRPELVTQAYVDWLNDPLVNRYLESRFAVADEQGTRQFVRRMLEDPSVLFLGIRSVALGRHVGNIKLAPIDRHHGLGEIGILIGDRSAWGRGIASAAIEQLARIARDELGLRKLTAGCYGSNAGSARAFQKAGFEMEGRRTRHFLSEGQPEDLLLMARFL